MGVFNLVFQLYFIYFLCMCIIRESTFLQVPLEARRKGIILRLKCGCNLPAIDAVNHTKVL